MKLKDLVQRVKNSKILAMLPRFDERKKEILVRESCLIGGFLLFGVGLFGVDWRLSLIICGLMLMKFSGFVEVKVRE